MAQVYASTKVSPSRKIHNFKDSLMTGCLAGKYLTSYLYSQAECVEHDEHKHDVLKPSGVHHIPELVLVWVLWDVSPQRTGFKSVFHALTLHTNTQNI